MNKNLALTGLTIFAALVMLTPTFTVVFAGVAGPVTTPKWINCINVFEGVGTTSKAYSGTSNILVSWIAPGEDSAGLSPLCIDKPFSLLQFTVQVFHRGVATASGPTFSSSSSFSSITVSVIRVVEICNKYGCVTHNYSYILLPGDGVCVNLLVWYGVYDDHSGGFCYYV